MEFPNNSPTSIHSISLSGVRWVCYREKDPLISGSSSETGYYEQVDNSPAEDIQSTHPLQRTELLLRQQGHHVFYEHLHCSLWVFEFLDKGVQDPHESPLHHHVLGITKDVQISEIFFGLVQIPSDLNDGPQSGSPQYSTRLTSNTESFPEMKSADSLHGALSASPSNADDATATDVSEKRALPTFDADLSPISTYRKFVSAVSLSLIRYLTKTNGWIPLGCSSCARAPTDGHLTVDGSSNLSLIHQDLDFLSLDIQWSWSCEMIISCRFKALSSVFRLSDQTKSDTSQESLASAFEVGTSLVISPFGITCRLIGSVPPTVKSNLSGQWTDEQQAGWPDGLEEAYKARTLSWLSDYGIRIPEPIRWLQLQLLVGSVEEVGATTKMGTSALLWPATLCFGTWNQIGHDPNGSQPRDIDNETNVFNRIAKNIFLDPLSKAERWYLDKPEREQAARAEREEIENQQVEGSPLSSESGEDEIYSEPIAQPIVYLSAQEASGIYPTPPDAVAFQAQNSISGQETYENSNDAADEKTTKTKEEDTQSHLMADDVENSGNRYSADVGQDLFGELDMEMFASNDLTEADFDFFDESDLGNEVTQSIKLEEFDRHFEAGGPFVSYDTDPTNDILASDGDEFSANELKIRGKSLTEGIGIDTEFRATSVKGDAVNLRLHESPQLLGDDQDVQTSHKAQIEFQREDSLAKDVDAIVAKRDSFDLVSFRERLRDFDSKYRNDGRFGDGDEEASRRPSLERSTSPNQKVPLIGLPDEETDCSSDQLEQMTLDDEAENSFMPGTPVTVERNKTPEPQQSDRTTRKRKRQKSDDVQVLATPAVSIISPTSSQGPNSTLLPAVEPAMVAYREVSDSADWFDSLLCSAKDTLFSMNERAFVQLAQIIADQAILRSSFMDGVRGSAWSYEGQLLVERQLFDDPILDAVRTIFPHSKSYSLDQFCNIQSKKSPTSASNLAAFEANQMQRGISPEKAEQHPSHEVLNIPASFVCIQRGDALMDIATPALDFWEELGLAPVSGEKNVTSFCIYPDDEAVKGSVSSFLETMESTYQSCKLGLHTRGSKLQLFQDGLVPVSTEVANLSEVMECISQACEVLGHQLSQHQAEEQTLVIYMADPFNSNESLPHLCAAFLKLFEAYAEPLRESQKDKANDLILQIIPIDFLISTETLVIPPPQAYVKLALEIYSRCLPVDIDLHYSPYASAPAIQLAKTIPRSINFTLNTQPSTGLLSSDRHFHLAYACEASQPWLTAAWTSNIGDVQWHASYSVEAGSWKSFFETADVLWRTTLQILDAKDGVWRIFIVKDGVMHKKEFEIWQSLASSASPSQQISTITTVATIDTNPLLWFPPPQPPLLPSVSSPPDTTSTPSSPYDSLPTPDQPSPQARTTQPQPSAPPTPTTATFDSEPETCLVDIREASWSIVIQTSLRDPNLPPLHMAQGSMSGYLIKNIHEEDERLSTVGVELLAHGLVADSSKAGDESSKTTESTNEEEVLRDMLKMYRDLATLAKVRNLDDGAGNKVPWHVLAARRAARALRWVRWRGEDGGGSGGSRKEEEEG